MKSLASLWMTARGSSSSTGSRRPVARSRVAATRSRPRSRWRRWARIVSGAVSILHANSRWSAGWPKPASAASSSARSTPSSSSTASGRGRTSASGMPCSQVTAQATYGAPSKVTCVTREDADVSQGATGRGTGPANLSAARWSRQAVTRSKTGRRERGPSFRTKSPPGPETPKFRSDSPGSGRTSPATPKTSRAIAAACPAGLFNSPAFPRPRSCTRAAPPPADAARNSPSAAASCTARCRIRGRGWAA